MLGTVTRTCIYTASRLCLVVAVERTNERVRTYLAQPVRERAHEGKYLEIRGSGVFVRGWERGRRDVARVV